LEPAKNGISGRALENHAPIRSSVEVPSDEVAEDPDAVLGLGFGLRG
jgi:hypothetical protein